MRAAGTDQDHVSQLADSIRSKVKLPRVQVIRVGDRHHVVDGHHTAIAYWEAGHPAVPCNVIPGTWDQAVLAASVANIKHDISGKRRTNDDKRRAVDEILKIYPTWTDRRIGELLQVAHGFVGGRRPQTEPGEREPDEQTAAPTREGKDGRQVPVKQKVVLASENGYESNGRVAIDWGGLDSRIGWLCRWPESLKSFVPEAEHTPEYAGMIRLLDELAKLVGDLRAKHAGA